MKLDVYAIEHEQGWRLNVSLDMRVDSLWWTATNKRDYPCQSLWHIASDLPVGWAFACMHHFNERLQRNRETILYEASLQHKAMSGSTINRSARRGSVRPHQMTGTGASASITIEQITQWLSEYIIRRQSSSSNFHYKRSIVAANSGDCFSDPRFVHSSETLSQLVFPCQLWNREQGWTGSGQYVLASQAIGQLQGDLQHAECKKQLACGAIALTGLVNGRSLLLAELHHLMENNQSRYATGWRSYIQLAYLQKHLRLLESVYVSDEASAENHHVHRSWSFLKMFKKSADLSSSRSIVCRRCGSTNIRYTNCASCGSSACGYCEQCLMMGRSRECGLLLQSVRPPIAVRVIEQPEPNTIIKQPVTTDRSISAQSLVAASSWTVPNRYRVEKQTAVAYIEGKKDIQTRWGLSNAQTAATLQALEFLQSKVDVSHQQLAQSRIGQLHQRFWRIWKSAVLKTKSQHSIRNIENIHNMEDCYLPVIKNGLVQMSQLPRSRRFLLWAVTGAGKTEMVLPSNRQMPSE
ncbi:hypothetical protein [Paenibacillus wenxiniae]|uniref:Uncharacterized protein n=1 Tax=Paenibacillus wenxiniae TaxID=1636843 RepID=A0ABW4RN71_9BACL